MQIWAEDGFLEQDFSIKVGFNWRATYPFQEMTTSAFL